LTLVHELPVPALPEPKRLVRFAVICPSGRELFYKSIDVFMRIKTHVERTRIGSTKTNSIVSKKLSESAYWFGAVGGVSADRKYVRKIVFRIS
jgi:hypothetical protein